MLFKTKNIKAKDIKREWHLIDAKDKILGRVSTQIAKLLMGKHKRQYSPNLDLGDYVVVINAKYIKLTGNKAKEKEYFRHSGYPGGFKRISFQRLMSISPEKVIKHAVSGMLPKNRLREKRLTRLKVFPEETHPYSSKFESEKNI